MNGYSVIHYSLQFFTKGIKIVMFVFRQLNHPSWELNSLPMLVAARSKEWVCGRPSLLRLWVRIPPETWMSVCCECCVLSARDVCDELITRPEESYRLWHVTLCVLPPHEHGDHGPLWATAPKKLITLITVVN